jgi:hypothetical protein
MVLVTAGGSGHLLGSVAKWQTKASYSGSGAGHSAALAEPGLNLSAVGLRRVGSQLSASHGAARVSVAGGNFCYFERQTGDWCFRRNLVSLALVNSTKICLYLERRKSECYSTRYYWQSLARLNLRSQA